MSNIPQTAAAWRPIESAPKNKPILVYCPEPVEIPYETFCWPKGLLLHVVLAHWHEPDRRSEDAAGWYAPWADFDGGVYDDPSYDFDPVFLKPTHWQPIPEPPKG